MRDRRSQNRSEAEERLREYLEHSIRKSEALEAWLAQLEQEVKGETNGG